MEARFDSEEQALQWLYSMQRLGVKLGLENVRRLLAALALSERELRYVHVAGTNGKGSTCVFVQALLVASGEVGVGLFTSPHLVRFNERIRDERGEIRGEELRELLGELREVTAEWEPQPTFFELALALGVMWFKRRGCVWGVMETGLGGRLDATNVVMPEVCVITRIGMDHMDMLGDTLEAIAGEKAGIIKPGVPVVTGPQAAEVMAVLRRVAEEKGSRLIEVVAPWGGAELGLAGEHQRWNAALAVAAVRAVGISLSEERIAAALGAVRWPGRFERLAGGVVLDGAHNEDGVRALVRTWREVFGPQKAVAVVGMVREKAVEEMLRGLGEVVGHWHLTDFQSPRAVPAEELRERLLRLGVSDAQIRCHAQVGAALEAAGLEGGPVLVCGSLYLVGEARGLLVPGAGVFEKSSQ
jgi:dihydrofolate synthase/folylpolyglutamate synthase